MDLIKEARSFEEAAKAGNRAFWVLILLVGGTKSRFENIVEERGS
jgi:hypothetical protein